MAVLPTAVKKSPTAYDSRGSSRMAALTRSKWARYFGGLVTFSIVLFYLFDKDTGSRATWSTRTSSISRNSKVHLLIPLNKSSLDQKSCTVLASALIHGYNPTLLNWNLEKDNSSDPLDHMQIAKLTALHEYLQDNRMDMDDESLVLMTDGNDMIFQLPEEHLLQRYAMLNRHRSHGEEVIITAADKGCHPNWLTEPEVCNAAPESPLPANTYGIDKGAFRHKHTRPRWSNTGMILGTAKRMRSFFAMLQADPDRPYWKTDQSPFNRLLGNRSDLLTLDYYSQLVWTGGGDFDNFHSVVVPRPLDGIDFTMIPYEAQLPRLGMASATGEIPIMLHFNLETGKESFLDKIEKEDAMKIALGQFWWSGGEERFSGIAEKLLSAGRIKIYGDDENGKKYVYTDLCEKSFLQ